MDKILVEVSIGELLDKISILDIKKDKIKGFRNTGSSCLIVPEGFVDECIILFEFSLKCALINPNITFIWRLHPLISFEKLKKNNKLF